MCVWGGGGGGGGIFPSIFLYEGPLIKIMYINAFYALMATSVAFSSALDA